VPAFETLQRLHEEGDLDLVIAVRRVAFHYETVCRYTEASALLEQAVATVRRVLGEEDGSMIGLEGHLGDAYTKQGRYAEAEVLLLDVLEARSSSRRAVRGDLEARRSTCSPAVRTRAPPASTCRRAP